MSAQYFSPLFISLTPVFTPIISHVLCDLIGLPYAYSSILCSIFIEWYGFFGSALAGLGLFIVKISGDKPKTDKKEIAKKDTDKTEKMKHPK